MGEEEDTEEKYMLIAKGTDVPRENGSQQYTGLGKAFYLNKDTYDGTFVEGMRRGKGAYSFAKNGDSYDGFYEENKKHGFGKMVYTSKTGDEEEGEEPDPDKPPRGGTYLGYFAAGKRGAQSVEAIAEGAATEGTFTYVNGDSYVGQWCAGKKHGKGTYSYAKDGTKMVGEWVAGKMTSGKWIFPNGTFYCGTFKYNKPTGKGVWVFGNGNQLVGEYSQKNQEPAGEDEPPAEDGEEAAPKADPKVWCTFKPEKTVAVRGGSMFAPSFPA